MLSNNFNKYLPGKSCLEAKSIAKSLGSSLSYI